MKSYGGRATANKTKRECEAYAKQLKKECDKYVQKNLDDIRFEIFKEVVQDDFQQAEAVMLYALSLHGFGSKRLQRVHEWVMAVLSMKNPLGKTPTSQDCMKYLKEMYDIDCRECTVEFEDKEHYDKK